MTDADEDFAPPPPRTPGRRLRKLVFWTFGLAGTVAIVLLLGRWQAGRLGERHLRAETARLDAEDPNWRLDAVLAARQNVKLPDDENAAAAVLAVAADVPDEWVRWRQGDDTNKLWPKHVDNRLPPAAAIEAARKHAAGTALVRTRAVRLRDKRAGGFPLDFPTDPIALTLPHLEKCRTVAALLRYDGQLAAIEKNPNRGVSAARAALAVSRAVGDEPLLISQLVRIACVVVAAQTAMQVIAWGEPTEGLAELQAELLAEAEVPFFGIGMRGERAVLDRTFHRLTDGTVPLEHWFRYANVQAPGPEHYAAYRTYRALIPGDHAKALEISSKYVEASKLPHHEQLAALRAVPIPKGPPEEFRYIITRLLVPASDRVAEAGLRARAEALAAATGVACERFRQKHGRWPREVAELVPAFLPAVPLNPFDGNPVTYRKFDDRVAVYFFWADTARKADDLPQDLRDGNPPGTAYGYRLWDPDRRGLPAEETHDP